MLGIVGAGEFWQALLVILVGATVLGVATWGAFRGNGYDREQPLWGKVALTGTFLVGGLVVVVLGMAAVVALLPRPIGQLSGHEMYMMVDDGECLPPGIPGHAGCGNAASGSQPGAGPGDRPTYRDSAADRVARVDAEDRQDYRIPTGRPRRFFVALDDR
jgi:hypothetical protein